MNDKVQLRQLYRDDLQFDAAVVRTDPLDPRIQVVGGRYRVRGAVAITCCAWARPTRSPVRSVTVGRFAAVSVVDELRDTLGGNTEDGGYVGAAQPGAAQPAGYITGPGGGCFPGGFDVAHGLAGGFGLGCEVPVEFGADVDAGGGGVGVVVEREVVADGALGGEQGAGLGDTDTVDVQLPVGAPPLRGDVVGAHCSHPFGRQARRRMVSRTTPGVTVACRGMLALWYPQGQPHLVWSPRSEMTWQPCRWSAEFTCGGDVGADHQKRLAAGQRVSKPRSRRVRFGLLGGATIDESAATVVLGEHLGVAVAQPQRCRAFPVVAEPADLRQLVADAMFGQVGEHAAGSDGRELARVTDEEQLRPCSTAAFADRDEIGGFGGPGLVDDDQVVAAQAPLLVVAVRSRRGHSRRTQRAAASRGGCPSTADDEGEGEYPLLSTLNL